jgi:hypothetical protein
MGRQGQVDDVGEDESRARPPLTTISTRAAPPLLLSAFDPARKRPSVY